MTQDLSLIEQGKEGQRLEGSFNNLDSLFNYVHTIHKPFHTFIHYNFWVTIFKTTYFDKVFWCII